MTDLTDILNDEPQAEPQADDVTEEVATEAEPAVEAGGEEAEPAQQEENAGSQEESAKKAEQEPQTVPLAAHIEQRRELQAKIAELAAKVDEIAKPKPEPVHVPDFVDPEAAAYFQSQIAQIQSGVAAEISEVRARSRFGDEVIDEAFKAAEAAGVVDQFRGRQDPWGDLGAWYKQQRVVSEIGDDPAAYKEKLRQELLVELKSEMAAQQVKAAAGNPPPSLAGMQGTGGAANQKWSGPASLDDLLK